MSDFEFTKVETKGATGIITMNRPDVFNALNYAGKHEIIRAIKQFNKDEQIRSIILTGEGKAFCSGQDLNDRTVTADGPVDIGNTLRTEWNPLIEAIRSSDKLVIAAVNGVCAGAGLSVVMACDLRVAIPKTRFISGFTQIGLAPDAGMSSVLVKSLGYAKALEFALMGKPLMSEEMLDLGLLNEISNQYLDKALELAESINALAPLSVKMVKKNLQYALDHSFNEVILRETYAQRFLGFSNDFKEGVKAFSQKRQPQFKGN